MRKIFWVIFGVSALLLAQGNAIFKVTDYPDHELCPRVSPDGTRLAYVDLKLNGPFPVANIRVATVDGKNAMLSTTGQGPQIDNQYPSWFPNSAQIAYERQVIVASNFTTYSIWAVPLNSANGTQLVQNNYNFSVMPDVSVNGDVVFVTSGNLNSPFPGFPPTRYGDVPPPASAMGNFMIAIQPAGESVVMNAVPGLYPRWSPDGKMIAAKVLPRIFKNTEIDILNLKTSGYVSSVEKVCEPVARGFGYAVLHENIVNFSPVFEQLNVIVPERPLVQDINVIYKKKWPLHPRYRGVIDHLKLRFKARQKNLSNIKIAAPYPVLYKIA